MTNLQRYAGCNHVAITHGRLSIANECVELRDADGRKWNLEWHHYFGPIACDKSGDPLSVQPGEKSRFWLLAQFWHDQGCRVLDGVAIWEMPKIVKTGQVVVAGKHVITLDMAKENKITGVLMDVFEYDGAPYLGEVLIESEIKP